MNRATEFAADLQGQPPKQEGQGSWFDGLTIEELKKLKEKLTPEQANALVFNWDVWARPNQKPPAGDWDGWLILAGRGAGKTRTATEWVRAEIEAKRAKRVALIAETSADGRDVLVEGESGILAISPPWNKPLYEPSKRRITWPNGAVATLYDAREPDQLRGPQHDLVVMDEWCKYRYYEEVLNQVLLGLRLGKKPRWLITTTPRPLRRLRELIRDKRVVVMRYSTMDNIKNLAPSFRANVIDRYQGTRIGRQEIEAEILEDVPGALWNRRNLDENRVSRNEVPALLRVAVAVDPSVTSGDSSNETGIVVGGMDQNQHGYVIEDCSLRGSPDQWARRSIAAYRQYEADSIIAESNQGGELVEKVIHSIAMDVPVKLVRASRGKFVRAEPVSAFYEQNKISHVGTLAALEDQMISFTPEAAAIRVGSDHWDRVDALVWLWSELFNAMTASIQRVSNEDDEPYSASTSIHNRDAYTGY